MRKGAKRILPVQEQALLAEAGQLYTRITALARRAVADHFTLDGFYYATQVCTTPEGSTILKTGSVLTVDDFVEHLFLERGFTKNELASPLIYLGMHWLRRVGKDRRVYGSEPIEIRTTYVHVGETEIKVIEREKQGAWSETTLREEDVAFLRRMQEASTMPLTIIATFGSQSAFDQAVLRATGARPYRAGIDFTTRQGRILFNGGLSHFTRILEKTRRGETLSSSSEVQTSRVLLWQQQGHFQTLFDIVSGHPLRLDAIALPLQQLRNREPGSQRKEE